MSHILLKVKDRMFQVEIVQKNVKNINLRVTPDTRIVVSANPEIHDDLIWDYVERKKDWIYQKVLYFEQFSLYGSDATYESGETFLYLGRQYRIKVVQSNRDDAKLVGRYLQIYTTKPSSYERRRKIVFQWYMHRAEAYLTELLHIHFPKIQKYGYEIPLLKIRVMKTRWGSYSLKTNTIYINLELIKTPKSCIEFILIHELVHIRFHRHDRDFYSYLTVLLPDWKARKEVLNAKIQNVLISYE